MTFVRPWFLWVPNSVWEPRVPETRFRGQRLPQGAAGAKQSFADVLSQTEFGTENE